MNNIEQTEPTLSATDPMFPALTPAQQTRVAAHGRVRQVESGETVAEPDTHGNKFFVVVTGQLNLIKLSGDKEGLVAVFGPGMFTGELHVLSGKVCPCGVFLWSVPIF